VLRSGDHKTVEVTLAEQPGDMNAAGPESGISELLGFQVSPYRSDLARQYGVESGNSGVFVVSIDPNSAAYQAGVHEGDLITGVNRQAVNSMSDFEDITSDLKKGDYVLLQVKREKSTFFLAFRL
jgi:serine protease Do